MYYHRSDGGGRVLIGKTTSRVRRVLVACAGTPLIIETRRLPSLNELRSHFWNNVQFSRRDRRTRSFVVLRRSASTRPSSRLPNADFKMTDSSPKRSKVSTLVQLKGFTTVVADTGDFESTYARCRMPLNSHNFGGSTRVHIAAKKPRFDLPAPEASETVLFSAPTRRFRSDSSRTKRKGKKTVPRAAVSLSLFVTVVGSRLICSGFKLGRRYQSRKVKVGARSVDH